MRIAPWHVFGSQRQRNVLGRKGGGAASDDQRCGESVPGGNTPTPSRPVYAVFANEDIAQIL